MFGEDGFHFFHGFQFDDEFPTDNQVGAERIGDSEVIDHDRNGFLGFDLEPCFAQSRRQHLLVNRLQQTRPQFGMQPESLIKHPLGQNVLPLHSVASLANVA